jgi:hypothetical protein
MRVQAGPALSPKRFLLRSVMQPERRCARFDSKQGLPSLSVLSNCAVRGTDCLQRDRKMAEAADE